MTKVCTKCKIEKDLSEFNKDKTRPDGYSYWCRACRKTHWHKNADKFKAKHKVYRINNKEKIKKIGEEYRRKNSKKIYARFYKWRKDKLDSDPYFRLVHTLRSRFGAAMKCKFKSASSLDLTGCDNWDDVRKHIEKQFTLGMSWDNYGKWHIDHIRPCASFDLTKESEQKECFNYKNLQPLWAKDNLSKGAKW